MKLTEENKRLRRELEEKGVLQEQAKENLGKERSIGKLSEEIRHLKRRVASGEEAMTRVREEKARVMTDNEELRRELQEGKWREKLAQKEEQERLIGFGRSLEELSVQKMNSSVEESTSEPDMLIPPPSELAKVALDLLNEGEKNEHEKVLQESKE